MGGGGGGGVRWWGVAKNLHTFHPVPSLCAVSVLPSLPLPRLFLPVPASVLPRVCAHSVRRCALRRPVLSARESDRWNANGPRRGIHAPAAASLGRAPGGGRQRRDAAAVGRRAGGRPLLLAPFDVLLFVLFDFDFDFDDDGGRRRWGRRAEEAVALGQRRRPRDDAGRAGDAPAELVAGRAGELLAYVLLRTENLKTRGEDREDGEDGGR